MAKVMVMRGKVRKVQRKDVSSRFAFQDSKRKGCGYIGNDQERSGE